MINIVVSIRRQAGLKKKKNEARDRVWTYTQEVNSSSVSCVFEPPGQWNNIHKDAKSSAAGRVLIQTRKATVNQTTEFQARLYVSRYETYAGPVSSGANELSGQDVVDRILAIIWKGVRP